MLNPVPKHHDEVRAIQPTWHVLLRFRQRIRTDPGTESAVAALRESLERAHLTRLPPGWIAGRERGAEMWAIDGDLAYPLSPGVAGEWVAATVLVRSAR